MQHYDLVIIGGGPAGMTAAIYAARADLHVLLLEKLVPGGNIINTNEIQNYPGAGFISGAELAIKMFEHVQMLKVEVEYRTVSGIRDLGTVKQIECVEDNAVYLAAAVIIATGTTPNRLGCQGEADFIGNGISWCAICDGAAYRDRDVVVIGGGNSAVEESIYLADLTRHLTLVTMFDLTADPIACSQLKEKPNVDIYIFQEILAFRGDHGSLKEVHFRSTQDGEEHTVGCDGVFEYIGMHPETDFAAPLGVCSPQGYIQVDQQLHTSVPGVFGAGDCITKTLRQTVTACGDGAVAAQEAFQYVKEQARR